LVKQKLEGVSLIEMPSGYFCTSFRGSFKNMKYRNSILGKLLLVILLHSFCAGYGFSQNLINNPGLESGQLLPSWEIWVGDVSAAVSIDSLNAHAGKYCAKLSGKFVFLYQSVTLEPTTKYSISAHIKTQPGQVAFLGVKGYGGAEVSVPFADTRYQSDTIVFTTGSIAGNNTQIFIWKADGSGSVWVDDLALLMDSTDIQADEPGGLGSYFVSPQGNDANSGNSPTDAWRSIEKVNRINFEPGDLVLFEGGKTFRGNIRLKVSDSGTPGKNLYIGSYGAGRASINATNGTGISASECNSLTIKNLIIIGDGRKTGNSGDGISLSSCSDVLIDSVDISGFQHSGLITRQVGRNYRFTNIFAHNNGFAGISISGNSKTSQSDIYIGYCTADNNPGDPTILNNHSGNGIIAFNASNILIEYCKASNNGWDMPRLGNGPGGIWVAEVNNAVIQYCIAYDNKTAPGATDGLGFDLDGGTTNSVIQYCLSYNNQGAGYGIFQYQGATDWANNTIRYCISENDGNVSGIGSVIFWNGTMNNNRFRGFEFYNNVVYNADGPAVAFVDHFNSNFNFRNNIFVSEYESVGNGVRNENFQGNCWYSLNNNFIIETMTDFNLWARNNNQEMYNGKIVGMYVDPELLNPGKSSLTDPSKLASVTDYQVNDESRVIDSGLDLKALFQIDPGLHDYFGNSIKQGMAFDMGVYENPNAAGIINLPDHQSSGFTIYPNPISRGDLIIDLSDSGNLSEFSISITSLDGRVLHRISNVNRNELNNNKMTLVLNNSLNKGVYLVSLIPKNLDVTTRKLIIN
jgi:hypothetical protein